MVNKFKRSIYFNPNTPLEVDKRILKDYIDKMAPPSCDVPFQNVFLTNHVSIFDNPFSFREIKDAIKSAKSNSAAGPDLIDYRIVKLLPDFCYWNAPYCL